MTIDAATLPQNEAGATLELGQEFVVRGNGLNNWPEDIVIGFNETNVTNSNDLTYTMELVGRTSESLTFRVRRTETYNNAHIWRYFGTPSEAPRTILEYDTM